MMLMQPSCRQQAARCPTVQCSARPQRPARRQSHTFSTVKRAQQLRQVIVRSTTAEGTLITKTEIPAFIPRADLMDQLTRWATIEIQESGVANVGMPCKVRWGQGWSGVACMCSFWDLHHGAALCRRRHLQVMSPLVQLLHWWTV